MQNFKNYRNFLFVCILVHSNVLVSTPIHPARLPSLICELPSRTHRQTRVLVTISNYVVLATFSFFKLTRMKRNLLSLSLPVSFEFTGMEITKTEETSAILSN